jgi:galactokinase
MNEVYEFNLNDFSNQNGGWREYINGVAWALSEAGYKLQGWEGVFSGDVPIGAGLSSSAALELAVARAFSISSRFSWEPEQMARMCQKAENLWVGVNSGIMDQMISACGKEEYALMIDCRSLETRQVPFPPNIRVVILDTATRRGLVDSAYNERREQCEKVAAHFEVPALRDIALNDLLAEKDNLDNVLFRRAKHVITGNQRVLEAVDAMAGGDAPEMGRLMNASHQSMRDDFEISRQEMDLMVEIAQSQEGCYGARMTGGGFGGCAVALVEKGAVGNFQAIVSREYQSLTRLDPQVYISEAVSGTSMEDLRG